MECGQETLCHVLTWLTDNELAARKFNDLIVRLGQDASGGLGVLAGIFKDYGQTIIGLLGFSFCVWRWWLYHERVLHKRLDGYISARDARLRDVRDKALNAIQRPAPGQKLIAPSFVNRDLKAVLRENRWDNSAVAPSVLASADWQLSKAISSISEKLAMAERAAVSLRQELCTAHSLQGAVAAARSGAEAHLDALTAFRNALSLPGHANDMQLKELEAHQLRKLGHFDAAEEAYELVIELARNLPSERDRNLCIGRAQRYLAEIEFHRSSWNAYLRMRAGLEGQYAPGPIALFEAAQPLTSWECLEKGDMHYFTAFLARLRDSHLAEDRHLRLAEASYQAAANHGAKRKGIARLISRRRRLIREGLQRIADAKNGGIYDTDWLPKVAVASDQAQKPAAEVGSAGGDQAVAETA
jgi:tetratricopeptide (TPR) repeat protein